MTTLSSSSSSVSDGVTTAVRRVQQQAITSTPGTCIAIEEKDVPFSSYKNDTNTNTNTTNNSIAPITHAISGSIGSAIALLVCYPFERIRIELQQQVVATVQSKTKTTAKRTKLKQKISLSTKKSNPETSSTCSSNSNSDDNDDDEEQQQNETNNNEMIGDTNNNNSNNNNERCTI